MPVHPQPEEDAVGGPGSLPEVGTGVHEGRRGSETKPPPDAAAFSIFGGPLHGLALRLRLARGIADDIPFGLAIGFALWIVLVALAIAQGVGQSLLSLQTIGGHVRLLLVIPLFFVGEAIVDPRMREFSRTIVRSGVVPPGAVPALEAAIERAARWRDSWLPEAACLAITVLWSLAWPHSQVYGSNAAYELGLTMAGPWYWAVCLPVFRFLMLRWLWRLALWTYFLWRVSVLPLRLVPTHPDGAAGLGFLEVVQGHFWLLVLAISLVLSASFAEELISGTMSFDSLYPAIALMLVFDAVLFLGPLFLFMPALWACHVKGLAEYTEFAQKYVNGFDRKWLDDGATPGEPLLGTPDLQSLADLSNSVAIVREMRLVPASTRLAVGLAIPALLPMLPLLLIKYPIGELLKMVFAKLSGY
jgi:hypothetical protein